MIIQKSLLFKNQSLKGNQKKDENYPRNSGVKFPSAEQLEFLDQRVHQVPDPMN